MKKMWTKKLLGLSLIGISSLFLFISVSKAAVSFYSNWNDVAALESQNKCKVNPDIASCHTVSAIKQAWLDYEALCQENIIPENECKAFYEKVNAKDSGSENFEIDLATNSCSIKGSSDTAELAISTHCTTYMQTSSGRTYARWCTLCCVIIRRSDGTTQSYCPDRPSCGDWEYAPEIFVFEHSGTRELTYPKCSA